MKQLLCTLLLAAVLHAESSKDTLHINLVSKPSGFASTFLQRLYNAITDSLDIIPAYHHYPEKRAELMMKNGTLDLDAARTLEFQDAHPEAIRVPIHFMTTRVLAFTTDSTIKLEDDWSTLSQKGLKVDYLRGMVIAEVKVPLYVPEKNHYAVNNVNSGMLRLMENRCDVFVCSQPLTRMWFIDNPTMREGIITAATLEKIELYPYLSHKQKNRIDALKKVISNMVQSKTIDSLYKETLREWLRENKESESKPDTSLLHGK